jgi:hypothetical protein
MRVTTAATRPPASAFEVVQFIVFLLLENLGSVAMWSVRLLAFRPVHVGQSSRARRARTDAATVCRRG